MFLEINIHVYHITILQVTLKLFEFDPPSVIEDVEQPMDIVIHQPLVRDPMKRMNKLMSRNFLNGWPDHQSPVRVKYTDDQKSDIDAAIEEYENEQVESLESILRVDQRSILRVDQRSILQEDQVVGSNYENEPILNNSKV
jgi:hypothetical protein